MNRTRFKGCDFKALSKNEMSNINGGIGLDGLYPYDPMPNEKTSSNHWNASFMKDIKS